MTISRAVLAERLDAERRISLERDRRYEQVRAAEARALVVKEEGDAKALVLARQIADYRDKEHNNFRDQIQEERAEFATQQQLGAAIDKFGVIVAPMVEFMASERGRTDGVAALRKTQMLLGGLIVTSIGAATAVLVAVN